MGAALYAFQRKKNLTTESSLKTILPRVLNVHDLTFLGIGSTLGAGVYVVVADIAKHTAGPGVILSFLIAAFAALLCGLCYAEFAARVPKAGSAYTYTYVTVGELPAFMVGWNLLLEYLIGAAAISRAWTAYVDSLTNSAISRGLMTGIATWKTPGISKYPDFLSLTMCLLASGFLAAGVRISSWISNITTFLNLVVIIFLIVVGLGYARPQNWQPFLPFGLQGMLSGSATAFFAFVGFDVIVSSAEEVKEPGKSIPRSIMSSIFVCLISYGGLSMAVTLMVPYYTLEEDAALAQALHKRGAIWAKYVISVGAVAGLTASLLGCMFPVPRLLFSMASDGLIFSPFMQINSITKTPIFGCVFSGILSGWLALYFDLSTLVEIMSIGTLQAYTMVATCVLLLRYQINPIGLVITANGLEPLLSESIVSENENVRFFPTKRTAMLANISIFVIVLVSFCLCGLCVNYSEYLWHLHFWFVVMFFFLIAAFTVAMTIIFLQPQNRFDLPFSVPMVPLLPVMSIFINITLMMQLRLITWIRFSVWITIGLLIYLFYGVQHSKENTEEE
ncbi:cationic amino acid transporter 2 isoform X1 [Hydra vulgaris]|uniref:cationic amino acid transporter 2 isoform X1 n=1 Tax=Hydra vulgaris TaxID=6087 RepID=UPI001F5ECFA3|nr:cationic amino acid transporter 2 [Hydra vulgaris]